MSNDNLPSTVESHLPAFPDLSEDEIAELGGNARSVGYLTLLQGQSKAVKDRKGYPGEFLLNGQINLGTEVTFTAVQAVPKARFSSENESIQTYDVSSEDFQRIKAASKTYKKGNYYGWEVLMYIPEHDAYAAFHFARTSQQAGGEVYKAGKAGKLCKIQSEERDGPENSTFYRANFVDTGRPAVEIPDQAKLKEALNVYREMRKPPADSPVER